MDTINQGDRVNIYFENIQCLLNVEILFIPCATGDSWIVKDELGNISYISFFSRMDKLPIIKPEADTEANPKWDE